MKMEKIINWQRKIEKGVVFGCKKIEDGVVSPYKKIENKFIGTFLASYSESSENENPN